MPLTGLVRAARVPGERRQEGGDAGVSGQARSAADGRRGDPVPGPQGQVQRLLQLHRAAAPGPYVPTVRGAVEIPHRSAAPSFSLSPLSHYQQTI